MLRGAQFFNWVSEIFWADGCCASPKSEAEKKQNVKRVLLIVMCLSRKFLQHECRERKEMERVRNSYVS